jgi:hypothetical protein
MSTTVIGSEASIPNPALQPFAPLIGEWQSVGHHPYLPGRTLQGRVSFAWLEGGAFLIMRSDVDAPEIPSGIAIFGSDNGANTYFMIYFDERGVSRKYDVAISGNQVTWQREDPSFSQRATMTIETPDRIVTRGAMSRNGADWEDDLSSTYTRVAAS